MKITLNGQIDRGKSMVLEIRMRMLNIATERFVRVSANNEYIFLIILLYMFLKTFH